MGCLFSLVQFAPDTWADDRLTIGIVAINEDNSRGACSFIQDWRRVRCFADGDFSFLRDFSKSLLARIPTGSKLLPPELTIENLQEMAAEYGNAIQLTEPSFADMDAVRWVDEFGPMFVRDLEKPARKIGSLNQREVAGDSRRFLRDYLQSAFRLRTAAQVVHEVEMPVHYETSRTIDAAIQNGRIHFGILAMSFDHQEEYTQKQIDLLVQRTQDLREVLKNTPLLVISDPFTTEVINSRARAKLEEQLIRRCDKLEVGFARLDQRPKIEARVDRVLTPEVLAELDAA